MPLATDHDSGNTHSSQTTDYSTTTSTTTTQQTNMKNTFHNHDDDIELNETGEMTRGDDEQQMNESPVVFSEDLNESDKGQSSTWITRKWDSLKTSSSNWWIHTVPKYLPSACLPVHTYLQSSENRRRVGRWTHKIITTLMVMALTCYLFYLVIIEDLLRKARDERKNLWIPAIGLFAWIFIAYLVNLFPLILELISIKILKRRPVPVKKNDDDLESGGTIESDNMKLAKSIDIECIIWGFSLQMLFGIVVLHWSFGYMCIERVGKAASTILSMSDAGAKFVFGENFLDHYLAFKVLPTIVFFSSVVSVLYYLNIIQVFLKGFAWVMMVTMGTSGAESLSASGNIFLGQTEAPLLIRPYLPTLTQSELLCVMNGGMASIAGAVMSAYIGFGVSAEHLIAASVMSAPASIAIAKIIIPETEEPKTRGSLQVHVQADGNNLMEAMTNGATTGGQLAYNVGVMLVAFVSIVALVNLILGTIGKWIFNFPQLTIELIFGYVFAPCAVLMGVPLSDALPVGVLLGKKTFLSEFVAYLDLMELVSANKITSRGYVIATYALCGFANFISVGIQIGGLSTIAPSRKGDVSKLAIKALIGGTLACFMTANVAALLI